MTDQSTVSGTATYRERIALPDGAEFEATLQDVSRADAVAKVVGQVRFDAPAAPPIRFTIPYDRQQIDEAHRYAVRARIVHGDQLLFTTDTHYPVLTQGAPETVDVVLRKVSSGAARATSKDRIRYGLYSYLADAGWFSDCKTGQRLPVAQEGDNAALEAAYLDSAGEPGESLLAVVEGRIEQRQPMEGEERPMLVVQRFRSL